MEITINTTMSSREIAELTGKMHKHVLVDCEKLNGNYQNMRLDEISSDVYLDKYGREQKQLMLTKMQVFDLMTGYNAELRIKVNRRWEELERANLQPAHKLPQNYSEALRQLAETVEQNEQQQQLIEQQRPKVAFTDAVIGSKTSCLIGELAKLISQNGINIGQNRLFAWLRENGYLGKRGEHHNIPMQRFIEQGLFEIKKGVRTGRGGELLTTITPKVTGKGQVYFVNKFLYESINNDEIEKQKKGGVK